MGTCSGGWRLGGALGCVHTQNRKGCDLNILLLCALLCTGVGASMGGILRNHHDLPVEAEGLRTLTIP